MDFPVTDEFRRTAWPPQLHGEARGDVPASEWPASFVHTPDGWVYRVDRDGIDPRRVRQAIDGHVPDRPAEPDVQLAAAINAATTVDELKAALTGTDVRVAASRKGTPT